MNRLERITQSTNLEGKRIVITGCGYKQLQHTFYDIVTKEPCHDIIKIDDQEMKLNIGSATAGILALSGATVHMVSQTKDKLENLKNYFINELKISEENIEYNEVDLFDEKSIENFIKSLKKDKPIYWFQSIGLGAGAYKVKDDNPYLHIEEIPPELLEKESTIVLKGTHILMQKLLPIFREQNKKFNTDTKIEIISSMSAIRGYNRGGTHCAAKAAISRYANSAMLDLWKEKIYITDIRPGAVDTGGYDNKIVQEAILEIVGEYGGRKYWEENGIGLAPPTSVGQSIEYIFSTPAHITSLNLVAKGQFPNEGS